MSSLEDKVIYFAGLMVSKMIEVADKHGGVNSKNSVTSPDYNFKSNINRNDIREHLLMEIGEFLSAKTLEQSRKEAIDVASCCMLLHRCLEEQGY